MPFQRNKTVRMEPECQERRTFTAAQRRTHSFTLVIALLALPRNCRAKPDLDQISQPESALSENRFDETLNDRLDLKMQARFIPPMLLLQKESLPEGPQWLYEIKLDGYRAIAFKTGGKIYLRSRNDSDFTARYSNICKALVSMPDETVIDGEVVALDEDGRPSFNILQNSGSSTNVLLVYYTFDLLILRGRDLMKESLAERRALLENEILPKLREPVRYSCPLEAGLSDLIHSVKAYGLEGLVAKHRDSRY